MNSFKLYTSILMFMFSSAFAFAQDTTPDDILNEAKTLFSEKRYQELLSKTEEGISLMSNDTINESFVWLLAYKFMAYNWTHNNKAARPYLLRAIHIAEKTNEISKSLLYSFYNSALNVNAGTAEAQREYLHVLLKENFNEEVLDSYVDVMFRLIGWSSNEDRKKLIKEEEQFVNELNNSILNLYFPYIAVEIELCDRGNSGLTCGSCNNSNLTNRIKQLIEQLSNNNNSVYKYIFDEAIYMCCQEVASYYRTNGQYKAASEYIRRRLDYLENNWKKMGLKSPWDSMCIELGSGSLSEFKRYMETLDKSKDYEIIVNYCNHILTKTEYQDLNDSHKLYILDYLYNAYNTLGRTSDASRVERIMCELSTEKEEDFYADVLSLCKKNPQKPQTFVDFYKNIYKEKGYFDDDNYILFLDALWENELYSSLDAVINYVLNSPDSHAVMDYFPEELGGIDGVPETFLKTQYDKDLFAYRSQWHWSNGNSTVWYSLCYKAKLYAKNGDLKNAIKNQLLVTDILRTDWEYHKSERSDFLSYQQESYALVFRMFHEEENAYIILSNYLIDNKEYSRAAYFLNKAIDLNLSILMDRVAYGSELNKLIEWNEWGELYSYITYKYTNLCSLSSELADVVTKASSIEKSFMLRLYTNRKNAIELSGDKGLKNCYDEYCKIEKQIEDSYYQNINNKTNLEERIAELGIKLQDGIEDRNLFKDITLTNNVIRKLLKNNQILIDFISVATDGGFIIVDEIPEYNLSNDTLYTSQEKAVCDNYAIIYKSDWETPQIVKLCPNTDFYRQVQGREFVYHVVFGNDETSINEGYANTSLYTKIWSKIFESVDINWESTEIFFVPSAELHSIAIENLPISSNTYMSDKYNLHRLSSIQELSTQVNVSTNDDSIFVLGDFAFNNTITNNVNRNMRRTKNSPLDRSGLVEMPSIKDEIKFIKSAWKSGKVEVYNSNDSTEDVFKALSSNSPSILHISTHGYNGVIRAENPEEDHYLYGNRTITDNLEKSLYETGLFMPLSLQKDSPTNGLLTSKEISLLDLSSTKLVVLSACRTATGKVGNEGVYGLPRAFKMAGVKTILASLWDVDLDATTLIIKSFYENLAKGMTLQESLVEAQKSVREFVDQDSTSIGSSKIYSKPYYWAGFVLIDAVE